MSFVVRACEDGGFEARCVEMSNAVGFGDTREEAIREYFGVAETVFAFMIEEGQAIPAPAGENQRTQQVNIRLTAMEKLRLEAVSKQQGFRSLSDFMRAASLGRAG